MQVVKVRDVGINLAAVATVELKHGYSGWEVDVVFVDGRARQFDPADAKELLGLFGLSQPPEKAQEPTG